MAAAAFAVLCMALFRDVSASGEDDGVNLPIVMYHSIVKDSSAAGEYVATVDELESDIAFLLSEGYTPVFCSEVADFVNGRVSLPEKPIVLTFDDGCYNSFYYVLPILEKYKVKAVFSVVGEWCMAAGEEAEHSPLYSCMELENVRTLVLSGFCEIANHSWNLHSLDDRRGVCRTDGEDDREYARMLMNDTSQAQNFLKQSGAILRTYAYPYGFCSDESEEIIRAFGYDVTLGCEEKTNFVSVGDYGCLVQMGRFNRPSGESSEEFFRQIIQI
jgi:peptidoglycan/xylan/chitin deacetylase (PgdA/CDA1 family)